MYLEDTYRVIDLQVIRQIIRSYPLAVVITLQDGEIEANHLPLCLEETGAGDLLLQGHVARNNPLWSTLPLQTKALAIFQGPQSYISPSWYPSKQETGKVVPTWNYIAVHLYGTLRAVHDPRWIRCQLERLTGQQEAANEPPWQVDDAPPEFVEKMLQAVVGIEFTVQRWSAKFKTSQNQSTENKQGVVHGLQQRKNLHDSAMADWVESTL